MEAAAADVEAMVDKLGGAVKFERVAGTVDQIRDYTLPTAPPKAQISVPPGRAAAPSKPRRSHPTSSSPKSGRPWFRGSTLPRWPRSDGERALEGLRLAVALDRLREAGEGQEA